MHSYLNTITDINLNCNFSGIVGSTVDSQQEDPEFDPWIGGPVSFCAEFASSPCVHVRFIWELRFFPHSPKTFKLIKDTELPYLAT